MSDQSAKDKGDRQSGVPADKPVLNTQEGQHVRNATGDQVEAIKAANPNASDGSVKNWALMTKAEKFAHVEKTGQDRSIELVDTEPSGREIVVAARQMVVEIEAKDQPATALQELAEIDSRPIKDYGFDVKQYGQDKVVRTGVEYQVGQRPEVTEQNLFERIGALPLEQQAQVIGAGIKAYNGELTHQQFRIGVGAITGLGDGVVGLAQSAESLGSSIIGVAQFSRDVMTNDPAAIDTAGKAGESLGKLMVGGIHVFGAADAYLGSLGAATTVGDYGKGLRDVAWLGQQMNQRWEAMSPEEKSRLATKLTVENLGGLAVGFGADRLAKSVKITEALETLGTEASAMGSGVREKASKLISRMADELMPQSMGVTPDGRLIPIKTDAGKIDDFAAKMVGRSGEYVPEHKPMFLAPGPNKVLSKREMEAFGGLKKLEAMSDGELASIGLRRYEMSKLRLESDEFSLQAKVPGDHRAWFRASVSKDGTLVLTDLSKGAMPDGTGAYFLAEALKAHNLKPTGKIFLKNIREKETLPALAAGVSPEHTKIGRCVTKGLKELGLTPTAFKLVETDRGIDIIIELR
ncbi:MAG: hypothetical protein QG574_4619 [Cyanobacteriota bacterium erpe_2018_sw_21hr_WHONDRS-SW48-000092_B_bin.40]|jgi:hypothetical protein|nr:hypothetical protein [Cyanobacteriota bacterium erpe_2018_sw_21hr_WHONDRS-SW48-000092_B_bin.40]